MAETVNCLRIVARSLRRILVKMTANITTTITVLATPTPYARL